MGFLDRLLGREPQGRPQRGTPAPTGSGAPAYGTAPTGPAPTRPAYGSAPTAPQPRPADDVAVERYRYLLRTAPPDAIERAHTEAFAKLTPAQRQQVLAELGAAVPASERARTDTPQDLARMATRAEVRSPGTLERTFANASTAPAGGAPGQAGGPPGAPGSAPVAGLGAMFGGSMLGTVAGVVVGSTVATMLFGPMFGDPSYLYGGGPGAGPDGGGFDGGGFDGGGFDGGGFDGGGFDGGGFDGF